MTQVYLIRHGHTEGPPSLNGRTNVSLSKKGLAQLTLTTQSLPAPKQILSSPKDRCLAFAENYGKRHGLNVEVNHMIREMDFGDWDGVPFDALSADWPSLEAFWQNPTKNSPPNGETLIDFSQRVVEFWQGFMQQEQPSSVFIFCHGGVIRMLIAHLLKLDITNPMLYQSLHIQHGSVTEINLSPFGAAIKSIGYRPFSSEELPGG